MSLTRRLLLGLAGLLVLTFAASACGDGGIGRVFGGGGGSGFDPDAAGAWRPDTLALPDDVPVQPVVANSRLGVGPTRLAFALYDRSGSLVLNAEVSAAFYRLDADHDGELAVEQDLYPVIVYENYEDELPPLSSAPPSVAPSSTHTISMLHEDPFGAVYVANLELDRPEWWGAALTVTLDGETYGPLPYRFFVAEDTPEPAIGERVPASEQPTLDDVDDVTEISSAQQPIPEMYEMTVAEALANGRPSVIAFATPAFCQSRFCGPIIEGAVAPVWYEYQDQANFIHIEPFDLEEARTNGRLVPVPQMEEWQLQTEPWIFVLDGQGRVVAKFEGIADSTEVRNALRQTLETASAPDA